VFSLDQSSCVAWHRKHTYSRWNFVAIPHTSWDIRYSISTSGYRPPSLIYYSPWPRSVRTSPIVFLDVKIVGFPWKFADISFVSWDTSYSRSGSRHFEFLWASPIISRHSRHHKKCAWTLLPIGENPIKKFQSILEIEGVQLVHPSRFTLQKSSHCSKVNLFSALQLELFLKSVVSKTPRFSHISHIFKSLHWLKIDQSPLSYLQNTAISKTFIYLLNQQANLFTVSYTVLLSLFEVHSGPLTQFS